MKKKINLTRIHNEEVHVPFDVRTESTRIEHLQEEIARLNKEIAFWREKYSELREKMKPSAWRYPIFLLLDILLVAVLFLWNIPDSRYANAFSVIVTLIALVVGIGVWFIKRI